MPLVMKATIRAVHQTVRSLREEREAFPGLIGGTEVGVGIGERLYASMTGHGALHKLGPVTSG